MEGGIRITNDAIQLDVKAVPGASRTELAGMKDNRLRVRIAATAEDGKANAALLAFFAKALGCSKSELRLAAGEKSRLKTLVLPRKCEVQLKQILPQEQEEE
jgi:uncharacterized protein (TIGR00251 family)